MLRARFPADIPVERGFALLTHGQVHYRAAGHGPVLLALHESPASSLSLQPLIAGLAGHYRVIAPDTPGYGLSDPLLADEPALEDFVAALQEFCDAMGLGRVALYGTHTGAALATAFAARCPDRVTALVLDGISVFNADEVYAFAKQYLPRYDPRWDGSHVTQIWSRVKDTFTWFPWYDRSPATRLQREPPSLDALDRGALALIQSGANYAKAYGLSAAFDPRAMLKAMQCPVTILTRAGDVLESHLDRLGSGPWMAERLDRGRSTWLCAVQSALKRGSPPDIAGVKRRPTGQGSRFLSMDRGWLHARLDWRGTGPVRLLLPGLPGDCAALLQQQRRLHPEARLIAIDLPGCGWSDPLVKLSVENVLGVLDRAVCGLGVEPHCIVGEGASAVIAALWAEHKGCLVEPVNEPQWLRRPTGLFAAPLPSPRQDGSHLTGAWFRLRDWVLCDMPPQSVPPDIDRLQRLFRSCIEGPEYAALLALVVDLVRRRPDVNPA